MVNWEALGAFGELFGAVLLLGSLVYVGVQIRDTKRQMMASTAQARTESFLELWRVRLDDGFLEAEHKSRNDPDALTDIERSKLINFLIMFLTYMQNVHYQRQVGTLEPSLTKTLDTMPLLTRTPFYRIIIEDSEFTVGYSEDFISHLRDVLKRQGT